MGIATFLRNQLAERGWSQQDLADRADMQAGSLTYILKRDHIVPQLETLDALARALDLPLAQLIAACGFEVSRPGDVYLSAEDAGLLTQITDQPDMHYAIKVLLKLPAAFQRMVYAFIAWAGKESAGEKGDIDELQVAVPDPSIMGTVYEAALHKTIETNTREIEEIRDEIEKLREALERHPSIDLDEEREQRGEHQQEPPSFDEATESTTSSPSEDPAEQHPAAPESPRKRRRKPKIDIS
jgi:transcriptional regulator with XRE-family HTH domain